jgi:elongation factor P
MQYLFREGDMFTFMDQESFEQTRSAARWSATQADFLTDNMICTVDLIEGEWSASRCRSRRCARWSRPTRW